MLPSNDIWLFGLCMFVITGPFIAGSEYDGHGWRE